MNRISKSNISNTGCNDPTEYNQLSTHEQALLQNWIAQYIKPHQIKSHSSYSSYGFKHLFERSTRGFYITNGTFKGAMLAAGFEPKDRDQLNWTYQLSKKAGIACG